MTDAEQRLISAVLDWQNSGYPQDRKNNLSRVRETAFSVAEERAPADTEVVIHRFLLASYKLPKDNYTYYEWDKIWDEAYASWSAYQGEIPYSHYNPKEEHKPFLEYFAARRAVSDLKLPPAVLDAKIERVKILFSEFYGVEP